MHTVNVPTVNQVLATAAETFGDATAFSCGGETITYRQLHADAMATAVAARTQTHPEGRVGIFCRDRMAFVTAFYGGILSGRLAFLLPSDATVEEAADIAAYFGIESMITDCPDMADHGLAVITPSAGTSASLPIDVSATEPASDDFAFALLTSGTTGKRRAVPVTHRNLVWTGTEFNRILGLSSGHRELVLIPLTHSFGARRLIAQLLSGGSVTAIDGVFNPAKALVALRDGACDVLAAVPPQIRTMLQGRFRRELEKLGPQVRHVELSSAPMLADEKADLVGLLPNAEINMGYGLTEASRSSLLSLNREIDRLETSGRPALPGVTLTIRDDDGAILAPGESGEVVISGPNVAKAYIVGHETITAPFAGQTFYTGDLGVLDADGYLRVIGRQDDMINAGGKKLHPAEVENILGEAFPALDCAIAGRPHPVLGAQPILCLVDGDGAGTDAEAVLALLRQRCEPHKVPAAVIRLAAIPRTANGKIIRPQLAAMLVAPPTKAPPA